MNLSSSRVKLGSSVMDSGLVVVVFIITSLIITVFSFLLFVDYEWCHVLFKNNTVGTNKCSTLLILNFVLRKQLKNHEAEVTQSEGRLDTISLDIKSLCYSSICIQRDRSYLKM